MWTTAVFAALSVTPARFAVDVVAWLRYGLSLAPTQAMPPALPAVLPDDEVDVTLLDWYLDLSVTERLRAASRAAATLDRLTRAASAHR